MILKDGCQADPDDAAALENVQKPLKTVGELRSLLRFLGYYRGYLKNFSIILKPLYDLLKVENNLPEIKATKGKKETTITFTVRFLCINKIYKRSPKYSK